MNHIHIMLITNAKINNIVMPLSGALLDFVLNLMNKPTIIVNPNRIHYQDDVKSSTINNKNK